MIRTLACVSILSLPWLGRAADPSVCVLAGPEVEPMCDGLKRIGHPFALLKKLDAEALKPCRVLILCGTQPPVGEDGKQVVQAFLSRGGAMLGVGGGATCMIRLGLFDAEAYYLTGTTVHMTCFHGYHRLTFGYPGAKPVDNWQAGVPNLLRATEGPLMMLGPKATSIIGYDGAVHSAAALQRVGKGRVLLIGPDPQGGKAVYSLRKPKLETGDKLKTDLLLANALAFLLDPHGNIIPNSGFEENTTLSDRQRHWQLVLRNGARSEWPAEGAPEGKTFLRILCPQPKSRGEAQPTCPIVVERGRSYRFSCMHKASSPWRLGFALLSGRPGALKRKSTTHKEMPAATGWQRVATDLRIPDDVSYLRPAATLAAQGELCLDAVTLRLSR